MSLSTTLSLALLVLSQPEKPMDDRMSFCCAPENDLYRIICRTRESSPSRFGDPREAISESDPGSALLILADGYPEETVSLSQELYDEAHRRSLRLYVEYPSWVPGLQLGPKRQAVWERVVVASERLSPRLPALRILAAHNAHFIETTCDSSLLVMARVAGLDSALYGLPDETWPLLFEHEMPMGGPALLVSTTKLSQAVTGRYAPIKDWMQVWTAILQWLSPEEPLASLTWDPVVRPSYGPLDRLPRPFERKALVRGIEWFFNSRMIIGEDWKGAYESAQAFPDRVGPAPERGWTPGDGTQGVLEGFSSSIRFDGSQEVRWWRRNDCNGETAGALALAGAARSDERWKTVAQNIGDYLYFQSLLSQGDRINPDHPAYGLLGWNDVPRYHGDMDGYEVYYADDNARSMLGMMAASAALQTSRWDERLALCLLANLRLTGRHGFQPNRIDQAPLEERGWKAYHEDETLSYSPHYQATLWACYLWAYRHAGLQIFLDRARIAIRMTMDAYPHGWQWTNGIQQERAKMLLPLAWLVRVDDAPEHRDWLRRIADDIRTDQAECGAIREELGAPDRAGYPPPSSNQSYGTTEAPLIQSSGDPVADMLYTSNFALLGLHEAAAATGEVFYRDMEDALVQFLCRIQIRSEARPELDGAWCRAFDFGRWEHWGSNADAGWGAWSIETGWTQTWITAVLSLRQLKTSLWEITKHSGIKAPVEQHRPQMLPDDILALDAP